MISDSYEEKSIEDLEKIAPGIINEMMQLSLFEEKCEETYENLSRGVHAFLKNKLNQDYDILVPDHVKNDPSPHFECYVVERSGISNPTSYKFMVDYVPIESA